MIYNRVNEKMQKAENARYTKINSLIQCLQGEGNSRVIDILAEDNFPTSFQVGSRISVEEKVISIGKRRYSAYEIQKVTTNTEGSMSIYDNNGKKICGTLWLNVGTRNIDLFCVWVRKNNIRVEVRPGKKRDFFNGFFCVL